MRKTFSIAVLSTLIALPLAVGPTAAEAGCQGRKDTGTVIGGLTGALLGNSISKGGGGAIVGGLGGAVVGHQIAKSGCNSAPRRTAYRTRTRYAPAQPSYAYQQQQQPVRKVYYDQYGNPIVAAPLPVYAR